MESLLWDYGKRNKKGNEAVGSLSVYVKESN